MRDGGYRWPWTAHGGVASILLYAAAAAGAVPGVIDVRFRSYTPADGLSQATALSMVQDRAGFLWIGTQDGLNRFDGYEFRVYRHERGDPWSLSDNHIPALAAAADEGLWVGTQAGGLDHYDAELDRFTHYVADPARKGALGSNHVTALLRDRRDRLWVATNDGHLQWFDPATEMFHEAPLTPSPPWHAIRALAEQPDGTLLVGAHEGLWRCDVEAGRAEELRFDPAQVLDTQALAVDPQGEIWVSSVTRGVFHFAADGAPRERYHSGADAAHALPDDETRGLAFDRSGRLWIATKTGGLLRLDRDGAGVIAYTHDPAAPDSLGANRQESVFVDRDGLIWAGSWVNGVSVHDPRTEAFALITSVPGDARTLPTSAVGEVYGDRDGTLWFGLVEGGGLVHYDLRRGVLMRYVNDPARPGSIARSVIQKVLRTRDGSLWVATADSGLERLPPRSDRFEHFRHDPADPGSLASDDLLYLLQDRAGTLWIGTADAGLDELCERCTTFRHHRHDPTRADSLGADPVSAILESRSGILWIGMRPGGLDRYDREHDRFEHLRARPSDPTSLSNDTVSTLYEDRAGDLWVGTQGGGLNRLLLTDSGPPRFEAITRAEGLAADAIGSIVEDADGMFWLTTTRGISRYDPRTRHIVNIGPRGGAQARGYFIHAGAQLADGRLVFGGLSGVTVFDPARVALPPSPRPVVDAVLLQNAAVELHWRDARSPLLAAPWSGRGEVELTHRQNNVGFEFGVLDFAAPEDVVFGYRLEGYDPDWIETAVNRRYAAYANLPAGDYQLRVRARSDGENWNDAEARVRLRVLPAPWASRPALLAYAASALALGLLVALRVRARRRHEAQAQAAILASEERLKFALWGSGGELWDADLRTDRLHRENRLEHLKASHEARSQHLAEYRPFVHPEDLPEFERRLRAHVKGETEFFEASYRTQGVDGDWRWLLSRGRVVERDASGRALRVVGTTQDITTLKRTEESLRRLNEELESRVEARTADLRKANTELRHTLEQLTLAQRQLLESEKMAALGGLVAGVAHEINTPLGVTVTAASHLQEEAARLARLAAEGALGAAELEHFRAIAQETAELMLRNLQRADRLIKSFKLVAVDQTTEERRTIEIGAYLNDILVSLGPVLKKTPHRVRIDCPQPLTLTTYPGALYQIVSNLVMNSLTHAFTAGQPGEIVLRVWRDGEHWYLEYSDNGKGMSEEVCARIFEPFFTTRRGQGGSGLGMHLVYNLVTQLLKGSIHVESAPGAGARFALSLPLEVPVAA